MDQDRNPPACFVFQEYWLFPGFAIENGGHHGTEIMAQVGAFLIDMVQPPVKTVAACHFFPAVAGNAFRPPAPVNNFPFRIQYIDSKRCFLNDVVEQVCHFHIHAITPREVLLQLIHSIVYGVFL